MKLCLVFSSFLFARLQIWLGRIPITGLCATLFVLSMQPMAFAANITIDTVPVGNAGNAADTHVIGGVTYHFGAVSYAYNIGTTEVTNAEYATFLNAKAQSDPFQLYDPEMADSSFSVWGGISRIGTDGSYAYTPISGRENLPVNYINW